MAVSRPFPPSARRRQLARRAGLHPASPILVGACAAAAASLAVAIAGEAWGRRIAQALSEACQGRLSFEPVRLLELTAITASPILLAASLAALLAHLAQVRSLWLPRRRIPGAPQPASGPAVRASRAIARSGAVVALAVVTLAWLWWTAAPLARILAAGAAGVVDASPVSIAGSSAAVGRAVLDILRHLAMTLLVAWLAVGTVDAIARTISHARMLRMSAAEKREDDRSGGANPRWARQRRALANDVPDEAAVAAAAVVLIGDDATAVIAWDPSRRPIPACVALGRGPHARRLLGLARRYHVVVLREPRLVRALPEHTGPIPEHLWPHLAELIAAARRSPTRRASPG